MAENKRYRADIEKVLNKLFIEELLSMAALSKEERLATKAKENGDIGSYNHHQRCIVALKASSNDRNYSMMELEEFKAHYEKRIAIWRGVATVAIVFLICIVVSALLPIIL